MGKIGGEPKIERFESGPEFRPEGMLNAGTAKYLQEEWDNFPPEEKSEWLRFLEEERTRRHEEVRVLRADKEAPKDRVEQAEAAEEWAERLLDKFGSE